MIVLNHGASFGVAERRRARPRARPPGHDGRRGTAPRARRDRDRQLRLAGDGPDDGDGPADVPARPRHAAWRATAGRRGPSRAARRSPTTRSTRTTASCATWPRSRSSRRSRTASPTTSGRCRPGGSPTSCCGSPAYFGVKPELVLKAGYRGLGAARRGQRHGRACRADPLPAGLGRQRSRRREPLGDVRVGARRGGPGLRTRLEASGRTVVAVGGTRGLTRAILARNRATAPIEIDPTRRPGHARRPAARGRARSPTSR